MKKNAIRFIVVWIGALVGLDQLIKYFISHKMALGEEIPLLPFLSLYHARNPGIAFSMLASFSDYGLIALTLIIIGFVAYLWKNANASQKIAHLGFLLVISGAIGNLIDRLRFHYVIDYISFYIDGYFSFAIFNLADVFITFGAILIVLEELYLIFRQKKK